MKRQDNISIREIKENKEYYLNLLLIADPSVDMIRHYLDRGHLYIMQLEEIPVCVTVVVSDKETAEIKNLATHPDYLRRGYASRMMSFIVEHYRKIPNIIVGTGSTGIPEKEFYQLDFYGNAALSNHILSKTSSSITIPNLSSKIMANNVST